ncbi:MAG: hypothetical protein M1840_005154 [Geoglossum simile]|nr:MAG: hypothetical protein M1840_005154 [Geoglossum simile]
MGWTALHTQINEFTPFSQLASHDGAPASVLFSNGLSTWYSWLGFAAVWVMTPLSSEIIYLDTDYCQNPNLKSPNNPCWPPRISVRPGIILILQVLLGIAAVTVAIAGIAWFHKPSGCSGDPTSIAAVAAIMGHPDVEWDFEGLGADITMEELKELLKDRKYKLGHYRLANGTERYGITPASQGDGAELAPRGNLNTSIPQRRWGFSFLRGWKNSALLIDGLFFCFLLGILGAITAYVKAVNNSSLAKVFEARTIGRRLLFALLGSLTASNWGRLGRESQTLSPYMRLSQPNAGPTSTILLKRRTLPFTAFFTMLRNQHFTAATIAFTSLLSELLVVTLSGIPYRPGQLRQEFLLCGIATFAILALMLAVLALASTWRRFFLPHLPRKPDSVAAVMTYVSGSSMNADFEGLEGLPVAQRDGQIKKFGKRYGYGLVRRGDGGVRWAVDEVQGTGEAARKFSSESSTSSTRAT